jgi:hypothetical protein
MRNAIGAIADRLIAMVVPRTTAGACPCPEGGTRWICRAGYLWKCELTCKCEYANCVYVSLC